MISLSAEKECNATNAFVTKNFVDREKLTEEVHLREDYVHFVAKTSLPYVMHVQRNVAHVIQRYIRKVRDVVIVHAFRGTFANHSRTVVRDLFAEVKDMIIKQILYHRILGERKEQNIALILY